MLILAIFVLLIVGNINFSSAKIFEKNKALLFDEQITVNDFHRIKFVSKNIEETSRDVGLRFYGESNASIYIVTIESPSDIIIVDGLQIITLRSNGSQTTAGSDHGGCFITDGTVLGGIGGGGGEGVQVGELRFLRFKFGELFNYTYDKRGYLTYEHNDQLYWFQSTLRDIIIPSGRWHLIFFGLAFDLDYDDVLYNYKVWLNFSEECEDLVLSTNEGGKIYGLCYAGLDANIIVSKSRASEFMLNGKASFNIENTFLFEFVRHPRANGFWNVKWNTPEGSKNFNMIMKNRKNYYNENKVEGCVWDVGKSGYYELSTSYFDYDYEEFRTDTPFFVGIDIKLP